MLWPCTLSIPLLSWQCCSVHQCYKFFIKNLINNKYKETKSCHEYRDAMLRCYALLLDSILRWLRSYIFIVSRRESSLIWLELALHLLFKLCLMPKLYLLFKLSHMFKLYLLFKLCLIFKLYLVFKMA